MNSCLARIFQWFLPPGVNYRETLMRAETFDLVYFCQLGTWTGPFVALFSGKMVTHMGLMWKHPVSGELYVFESVRHKDDARDIASGGRKHLGVRLTSLETKLRRPDERYFVCIQKIDIDSPRHRLECTQKLDRFIMSHTNIQFEQNVSSFFFNQWPVSWNPYCREDTSSLFCSELVALALRECGLLIGVDNVSAVWPSMFWDCQFILVPGASLSTHKWLVQVSADPVVWNAPATTAIAAPIKAPTPQEILADLERRSKSGEHVLVHLLTYAKSPDQ